MFSNRKRIYHLKSWIQYKKVNLFFLEDEFSAKIKEMMKKSVFLYLFFKYYILIIYIFLKNNIKKKKITSIVLVIGATICHGLLKKKIFFLRSKI